MNRALPHWRVEQDLRASPIGWTFLRPSFFAAKLVLDDPAPHAGLPYTLTGPAKLDYHRVASMLSAELGRVVVYEPQTHDRRDRWTAT